MQKHWFLKRWFIQGLVVSLPIVITAVIFYYCISYTDRFLLFTANLLPTNLPKPVFPGMGLIIFSILLILLGAITENFLIKKLVQVFNYLISKLPFIRNVYPSVLKVVQNILGNYGKYSKVLLIEYPKEGFYVVGFKTNEASEYVCKLIGQKMISVFIPTTPSPAGGMYLIVPANKIIETDLKPDEAFKLILSAGIIDDKEIK